MLTGVARIVVYLLLIIPLIVISFLITKHIQFAFDVRKDFIEGNKLQIPSGDMQQIMATNELSTRSFFLIFICFLMILCGLLITLKATENAFVTSKEIKVKYSLRTAYPGVIMAIFGCLLLAYSVYKSSQLQLANTHYLIGLKDTTQRQIIEKTESGDDIVYQADLDTAYERSSDEKEILLMEEEVAAIKNDKHQDPALIAPVEKKNTYQQAVTADDVKWADQLAVRSIAYGYYPTPSDNGRYTSILKSLSKGTQNLHLNTDLQWAFRLLQKTQNGYAPTEGELKRYEIIVGNQIENKKQELERKSAGNF